MPDTPMPQRGGLFGRVFGGRGSYEKQTLKDKIREELQDEIRSAPLLPNVPDSVKERLWFFAVILAGPLFWLFAFPPHDQGNGALFFAIPALLWAYTQPRFKYYLTAVFLAGLLSWVASLIWLRNAPHAIDGWHPLAASALGWGMTVALSAVLAVFYAAFFAAAWFVLPKLAAHRASMRIMGLLGLAAFWTLLEWLRSWVFTGFPWMPLALSQWQNPGMIQMIATTGAGGLSFVIIFFNLGVAAYLRQAFTKRGRKWWKRLSPEFYAAMGLLMWNFSFSLGEALWIPDSKREYLFTAGLVQPFVPQHQKWDLERGLASLDALQSLTIDAREGGGEIIFWPESVAPWPILGEPEMRLWAEELATKVESPILGGHIVVEGNRSDPASVWYNAVALVDPRKGLITDSIYAKRHLVPFGEYVPLSEILPFIKKLVPIEGSFGKGSAPVVIPIEIYKDSYLRNTSGPRLYEVGSLICYEDIFGNLARDSVRNGADFLFVATNNGWFGEEGGAVQHAAHSILRAVETRRIVIRSGNGGWSGWIDEAGRIRSAMLHPEHGPYYKGTKTMLITRIPGGDKIITPYVQYGEWFTAFCAVLAFMAAWVLFLRKKRA